MNSKLALAGAVCQLSRFDHQTDLMPSGWSAYPDVSGAAKDANLRVILIDRLTVNDPSGQPKGTKGNRLVQLVAPAKDQSGRLQCW
jgi:hypothetical protein